MHVPPSRESVRELMPTFFELLQQERSRQFALSWGILHSFTFTRVLESASVRGDIKPFSKFLAEIVGNETHGDA
jgi:hypothetical protein